MDKTDSNDPKQTVMKKPPLTLSGLATAAGSIVCLCTLTGFLGGSFWMFELTSHFRVQYFVILLGLAGALSLGRRWRSAALFFSFALINFWLLIPYIGFTKAAIDSDQNAVCLLAWNVNSQTRNFAELDQLLKEYDPDIVMLMEVSSKWGNHVNQLTNYSHRHIVARDDNFGIAILGRDLITHSETRYLGEAGLPSILSEIKTDRGLLQLFSTHPLPPVGAARSHLRNDQLDRIASWTITQTNAVIVAGDLNTTPWSPVFTQFIKRTDLKNSARGRGLHGTWPAFFTPMIIPIDHFLYSADITVTRREILNTKGSDHFPQLIEFVHR